MAKTYLNELGVDALVARVNSTLRGRIKYKGELALIPAGGTTRTNWNDMAPCIEGHAYILTGSEGQFIELDGVRYMTGDMIFATNEVVIKLDGTVSANVQVKKISGGSTIIDEKSIVQNDDTTYALDGALRTAVGGWKELAAAKIEFKQTDKKDIGQTWVKTVVVDGDATAVITKHTVGEIVSAKVYPADDPLDVRSFNMTYDGLTTTGSAHYRFSSAQSGFEGNIEFYAVDATHISITGTFTGNRMCDNVDKTVELCLLDATYTYHPLETKFIDKDNLTLVSEEVTGHEVEVLRAKTAIEIAAFPVLAKTETMYRLTQEVTVGDKKYAKGLYVYDLSDPLDPKWISVGGSEVDEKTIRSKNDEGAIVPLYTQIGGWKGETIADFPLARTTNTFQSSMMDNEFHVDNWELPYDYETIKQCASTAPKVVIKFIHKTGAFPDATCSYTFHEYSTEHNWYEFLSDVTDCGQIRFKPHATNPNVSLLDSWSWDISGLEDGELWYFELTFKNAKTEVLHPMKTEYINLDTISIVNDTSDTTALTGTVHARSAIEVSSFPTTGILEQTIYRLTQEQTIAEKKYAKGIYVYDKVTDPANPKWLSVGGSEVDEKTIRSATDDGAIVPLYTEVGGWKENGITAEEVNNLNHWSIADFIDVTLAGKVYFTATRKKNKLGTTNIKFANLVSGSYFDVEFLDHIDHDTGEPIWDSFSSGTITYAGLTTKGYKFISAGTDSKGRPWELYIDPNFDKFTVATNDTDWTSGHGVQAAFCNLTVPSINHPLKSEFVNLDKITLVNEEGLTEELTGLLHAKSAIEIAAFPTENILPETIYRLTTAVTVSGVNCAAGLYVYDPSLDTPFKWVRVGGRLLDEKTVRSINDVGENVPVYTQIGGSYETNYVTTGTTAFPTNVWKPTTELTYIMLDDTRNNVVFKDYINLKKIKNGLPIKLKVYKSSSSTEVLDLVETALTDFEVLSTLEGLLAAWKGKLKILSGAKNIGATIVINQGYSTSYKNLTLFGDIVALDNTKDYVSPVVKIEINDRTINYVDNDFISIDNDSIKLNESKQLQGKKEDKKTIMNEYLNILLTIVGGGYIKELYSIEKTNIYSDSTSSSSTLMTHYFECLIDRTLIPADANDGIFICDFEMDDGQKYHVVNYLTDREKLIFKDSNHECISGWLNNNTWQVGTRLLSASTNLKGNIHKLKLIFFNNQKIASQFIPADLKTIRTKLDDGTYVKPYTQIGGSLDKDHTVFINGYTTMNIVQTGTNDYRILAQKQPLGKQRKDICNFLKGVSKIVIKTKDTTSGSAIPLFEKTLIYFGIGYQDAGVTEELFLPEGKTLDTLNPDYDDYYVLAFSTSLNDYVGFISVHASTSTDITGHTFYYTTTFKEDYINYADSKFINIDNKTILRKDSDRNTSCFSTEIGGWKQYLSKILFHKSATASTLYANPWTAYQTFACHIWLILNNYVGKLLTCYCWEDGHLDAKETFTMTIGGKKSARVYYFENTSTEYYGKFLLDYTRNNYVVCTAEFQGSSIKNNKNMHVQALFLTGRTRNHPIDTKHINVDNITICPTYVDSVDVADYSESLALKLKANSAILIDAFPDTPKTEVIYNLLEDYYNYSRNYRKGLYVFVLDNDDYGNSWKRVGGEDELVAYTTNVETTLYEQKGFGTLASSYYNGGKYTFCMDNFNAKEMTRRKDLNWYIKFTLYDTNNNKICLDVELEYHPDTDIFGVYNSNAFAYLELKYTRGATLTIVYQATYTAAPNKADFKIYSKKTHYPFDPQFIPTDNVTTFVSNDTAKLKVKHNYTLELDSIYGLKTSIGGKAIGTINGTLSNRLTSATGDVYGNNRYFDFARNEDTLTTQVQNMRDVANAGKFIITRVYFKYTTSDSVEHIVDASNLNLKFGTDVTYDRGINCKLGVYLGKTWYIHVEFHGRRFTIEDSGGQATGWDDTHNTITNVNITYKIDNFNYYIPAGVVPTDDITIRESSSKVATVIGGGRTNSEVNILAEKTLGTAKARVQYAKNYTGYRFFNTGLNYKNIPWHQQMFMKATLTFEDGTTSTYELEARPADRTFNGGGMFAYFGTNSLMDVYLSRVAGNITSAKIRVYLKLGYTNLKPEFIPVSNNLSLTKDNSKLTVNHNESLITDDTNKYLKTAAGGEYYPAASGNMLYSNVKSDAVVDGSNTVYTYLVWGNETNRKYKVANKVTITNGQFVITHKDVDLTTDVQLTLSYTKAVYDGDYGTIGAKYKLDVKDSRGKSFWWIMPKDDTLIWNHYFATDQTLINNQPFTIEHVAPWATWSRPETILPIESKYIPIDNKSIIINKNNTLETAVGGYIELGDYKTLRWNWSGNHGTNQYLYGHCGIFSSETLTLPDDLKLTVGLAYITGKFYHKYNGRGWVTIELNHAVYDPYNSSNDYLVFTSYNETWKTEVRVFIKRATGRGQAFIGIADSNSGEWRSLSGWSAWYDYTLYYKDSGIHKIDGKFIATDNHTIIMSDKDQNHGLQTAVGGGESDKITSKYDRLYLYTSAEKVTDDYVEYTITNDNTPFYKTYAIDLKLGTIIKTGKILIRDSWNITDDSLIKTISPNEYVCTSIEGNIVTFTCKDATKVNDFIKFDLTGVTGVINTPVTFRTSEVTGAVGTKTIGARNVILNFEIINHNIDYIKTKFLPSGTSLPASAEDGTIFFLYT